MTELFELAGLNVVFGSPNMILKNRRKKWSVGVTDFLVHSTNSL